MAEKKPAGKKTTAKKSTAKSGKKRTTPPGKKKGLTAFEERFCQEYMYAPSGAKAARRAGSEATRADQIAYALLRKVEVQERIAELKAAYMEKSGLKIESIYRYLDAVINFDIRDLYHEDGRLKQPHELAPDVAMAIQGMKVRELMGGSGDERTVIGQDVEYNVANRNDAADKALKALGAYREIIELQADSTLRGIFNAISGRTVGPPGLRTGPQGIAGGAGGNRGQG